MTSHLTQNQYILPQFVRDWASIDARHCLSFLIVGIAMSASYVGGSSANAQTEIAKAYVQAMTGGSGAKAAGVVDFAQIGCTPQTVWDADRCQRVVYSNRDGKTILMDAIGSSNIEKLIPPADLERVYFGGPAYVGAKSMFDHLSTPGNGWYNGHEGPGGAKEILRNYISAIKQRQARTEKRVWLESIVQRAQTESQSDEIVLNVIVDGRTYRIPEHSYFTINGGTMTGTIGRGFSGNRSVSINKVYTGRALRVTVTEIDDTSADDTLGAFTVYSGTNDGGHSADMTGDGGHYVVLY